MDMAPLRRMKLKNKLRTHSYLLFLTGILIAVILVFFSGIAAFFRLEDIQKHLKSVCRISGSVRGDDLRYFHGRD